MSNGVEPIDGPETGKRLVELAHRAREIGIISPFISESGADILIKALKGRRQLTLRILTRAEPQDVIQGILQPKALERLLQFATKGDRSVEIRRDPRVHAKLYLFDDRVAIVGSANMTKHGLIEGNRELCCLVTKRPIVKQLGSCFSKWFDAGDVLTSDYVALLQGFEEQYASLKQKLESLHSFGELCSVQTLKTERDYFASVLRLLDVLEKPSAPTRIAEMLKRGHQAAQGLDDREENRFNVGKRLSMLRLLGLVTEKDGRLERGPYADEVLGSQGQKRLWEKMQLAYPDLKKVLDCFHNDSTMTVGDLAKILGISELQRGHLYPTVNWLVALGHLNKSGGVPYQLSRRHAQTRRRSRGGVRT
jgi:HKD family nuclease